MKLLTLLVTLIPSIASGQTLWLEAPEAFRSPVVLTWTAGSGGPYTLLVGGESGRTDLTLPVGASRSLVAVVPSGRFYVRVAGAGQVSNQVALVVGAAVDPTHPTLSVSQPDGLVSLHWDDSVFAPFASGFTLQAGTTPTNANLLTAEMGTSTELVAAAPAGLPIFVRIVGHYDSGEIRASNVVAFEIPTKPEMLRPSIENGQIRLHWSGSPAYLEASLNGMAFRVPVSGNSFLVPTGLPSGVYVVSVGGVAVTLLL